MHDTEKQILKADNRKPNSNSTPRNESPNPNPKQPKSWRPGQFDHERLDAYWVATDALARGDHLAQNLPRGYAKLADQLRRALLSAYLGVAEASCRTGKDRLARFRCARGEAAEAAAALEAVDPNEAEPDEVNKLLREQYPDVQLCIPKDGEPYALARVHTATLISTNAACCIHQRPIPGKTNEIGAMPGLLKELRAAYGKTHIMQRVTTDAGNTSLGVATMLVDQMRVGYFAQFKSEHAQLHAEATRTLGNKKLRDADARYTDEQNGFVVTYHLWCHNLSEHGWLDWTHARQLIRVRRVAKHPDTGKRTEGNRYYVCSKTTGELMPETALKISRGHWRCENCTHWTADAVLHEDRRRLAWSRHPVGVFIVSLLRMIALNIMAVVRKLSRVGQSKETPTWQQVAEHFLLVLCSTILNTEQFDAID